jgi:small subunit ribosomal protein S6
LAVNLYEAMFVVDAGKGGAAFPDVIRHIASILTRHGAEAERMEKWDERKLAYPIGRSKRGIYILVYFRADGSAIEQMRGDANLSEELLRVLILRAEKMDPVKGDLFSPEGEPIEKAEKEPAAEQETPPADEEATEDDEEAAEAEKEQSEAADEQEAEGEPEEPAEADAEEAEQQA